MKSVCSSISNPNEKEACARAGGFNWQASVPLCRSIADPNARNACVNDNCAFITNPAEKQACTSQGGAAQTATWQARIGQCGPIPANNPSKLACVKSVCGSISNPAEKEACARAGGFNWQASVPLCRSIADPNARNACVNDNCAFITNPAEQQACTGQSTTGAALQQINAIRGQVNGLRQQARTLCGQIPDANQRAACLKEFS